MHFVKQASLLLAALPEWPYLHCQWVTVGLNLSSFLYALVPHLTSDLEGPPELHSFKGSSEDEMRTTYTVVSRFSVS